MKKPSSKVASELAAPGTAPGELSLEALAALPDAAIDTSNIPDLDEAFWSRAKLVQPDRTKLVTLRVKQSVLDAFKAQAAGTPAEGGKRAGDRKAGAARGYQTHMNAVLESYVRTVLAGRKGA